jgi:hypothetical protein
MRPPHRQVEQPFAPREYNYRPFKWKNRGSGNPNVPLAQCALQMVARNAAGSLQGLVLDTYWHGGLEGVGAGVRSEGLVYEPQVVNIDLSALPEGTTYLTLYAYNMQQDEVDGDTMSDTRRNELRTQVGKAWIGFKSGRKANRLFKGYW